MYFSQTERESWSLIFTFNEVRRPFTAVTGDTLNYMSYYAIKIQRPQSLYNLRE